MSLPKAATHQYLPKWTYYTPVLAAIVFVLHHYISAPWFLFVMVVVLVGSVLAAVQHAEIIAHQIGEPIGTVVLALAVTVIEVSLIVSLTFSGKEADSGLARDTVFAAVMIILNGMIGLCILTGGLKFREQVFGLQGVSSALTILVAISVLTLILPNYTTSVPGPSYNKEQLVFVAIVTVLLYATFIVVQNFRHKNLFLSPEELACEMVFEKPGKRVAWLSFPFLIICLAAVVLLAEGLAPSLDNWLESRGAPHAWVGLIIASIILLPEGITAFQAAMKNNLQKSLNLSLGSALATIGLTIPCVSIIAVVTGTPLALGIDVKSTVLFFLSLLVIILSLSTGKTTILQGIVLLIIFSVYIFMTINP
jgi:Ca2+:H+ antiporter